MGTAITLDVGDMTVDWNKNHRGADHGALFQSSDRTRRPSEQIDYGYFDTDDPQLADMEAAFARSLADIVPRLELMGFCLGSIEAAYNRAAEASRDYRADLDDAEVESPVETMTWAEFLGFVNAHPIEDLDDTFISGFGVEARRRSMGRFADNGAIERIPFYSSGDNGYSERSHYGDLFRFLHPYAVRRTLAECPANRQLEVVWRYGALVNTGWATRGEFKPEARRAQTFLIATEGSSDTQILKHALALLRPHITDFFRFVDMSDGYPFTGTGSLRNFATGLAGIDVHNQVLLVLDNDAEGRDACARIERLRLPANMRATCLPDLAELEAIPARGPDGLRASDVNDRAAAIECYLDLDAPQLPPPEVRWTNYKAAADIYQGALVRKDTHTRLFLKQTKSSLMEGSYDPTKITKVVDHIFRVCAEIAAENNQWFRSPVSSYVLRAKVARSNDLEPASTHPLRRVLTTVAKHLIQAVGPEQQHTNTFTQFQP